MQKHYHKDIRFINVEYDSKAVKRMKEPQRSILEITKKAMKAFFGVIGTCTGCDLSHFHHADRARTV